MALLRSRTLLVGLAALLIAAAGFGWHALRPPAWVLWVGETSLAIQVDGAPADGSRLRVRGQSPGPGHRGTVNGDRLRFSGLTPDTPYTIEWLAGPFVAASTTRTTLPAILPAVDLDVEPGAGKLTVRLRRRDARLNDVEMALASGGQTLTHVGRSFEVPLPEGRNSVDLELVLPGTGDVFALDLPVLGVERLLEELGRAEADLEPLLGEADNPALLPPAALEPWEPSPLPARRTAATGGPGLLARLRRLAPLVRATAAGTAPLPARWRLALATSRLAGVEVLARKHQQPALGVLDWAHDLVRFTADPDRLRDIGSRNILSHPAHLAHPDYSKSGVSQLVEVIGGTADSKTVNVLPLPHFAATPDAWRGLTLGMQCVFNSGPPVLRYPHAGAAVEVPLVERPTTGSSTAGTWAQTFPGVFVDVWIKKLPPDGDWETAVLEATHRPRSKRVSPSYVGLVAPLDHAPSEKEK